MNQTRMVNTTQLILENIQKADENGVYIPGLTLFDRIFNFIDQHFFSWDVHNIMAENHASFICRKSETQSPQYPMVLLKYKKCYVLSFQKQYYKSLKTNAFFFIRVVQYFMIDFIMALKDRLATSHQFIHQGRFHLCLLQSLFSIRGPQHNIHIIYQNTKQPFYPVLMENWSASCYLDSLLTILLLGDFEIWRTIVFRTKVHNFLDDIQGFINPTAQEITDTEEKAQRYANTVRVQLRKEYNILIGATKIHGNYQCRQFRELMSHSNPGMKNSANQYVTYYTSTIYETFTKLFKNTRFYLPVTMYGSANSEIYYSYYETILMDNYMLSVEIEENGFENILWEKTDAPYLVFASASQIRFPNYAQGTPRAFMYRQNDQGTFIPEPVEVKRWFGEYILEDRYRLMGAICHIGNVNGPGGHFVSFLRPFFDSNVWYFYDDLKSKKQHPSFQFFSNFCPPAIFMDDGNTRPDMLFYVRIP